MNTLCVIVVAAPFVVLAFGGCALYRPSDDAFKSYAKQIKHVYVGGNTNALREVEFRQEYDRLVAAGPSRYYEAQIERNKIVNQLVLLIDDNYYRYEAQVMGGRAVFDTASETTVGGLAAAGTLAGGASLKALLAAISGGISGLNVSVSKNVFREQASALLASEMRALRSTSLQEIRGRTNDGVSDYDLDAAIGDLVGYYNAGTIPSAFDALYKKAGSDFAQVDKRIQSDLLQAMVLNKSNQVQLASYWASAAQVEDAVKRGQVDLATTLVLDFAKAYPGESIQQAKLREMVRKRLNDDVSRTAGELSRTTDAGRQTDLTQRLEYLRGLLQKVDSVAKPKETGAAESGASS